MCNFHDISFQGAQGEAGDSGPPGPPGPAVSILPTLAILNNAQELVCLTLRTILERLSEIHKEWLFSLSITTHLDSFVDYRQGEQHASPVRVPKPVYARVGQRCSNTLA